MCIVNMITFADHMGMFQTYGPKKGPKLTCSEIDSPPSKLLRTNYASVLAKIFDSTPHAETQQTNMKQNKMFMTFCYHIF